MSNIRTPAELQIALEALLGEFRATDWNDAAAESLVPCALSLKAACEHAALVHAQIELRALANGVPVPGAAVKDQIVHRIWNDQDAAEQLAQEAFGDAAFKRSLLSPVGIEKLGPGGKNFVAVCSQKPAAGKRVVY